MGFRLFEKGKPEISDKPYDKQSDSELVESIIGGKTDAFTELVKRYEKLVYNTAYFNTQNSEDAWDISQEVFLRVYNSMESFRGESAFSTWLYRLCKNITYDYMRKHYKHKSVSISDIGSEDDGKEFDIPDNDISSDPQASFERKYEIERVRQAIKKLGEEHRSVIILRELEERSYSEIAEILDIEEGTVKSRLNRARLALKKILSE